MSLVLASSLVSSTPPLCTAIQLSFPISFGKVCQRSLSFSFRLKEFLQGKVTVVSFVSIFNEEGGYWLTPRAIRKVVPLQ